MPKDDLDKAIKYYDSAIKNCDIPSPFLLIDRNEMYLAKEKREATELATAVVKVYNHFPLRNKRSGLSTAKIQPRLHSKLSISPNYTEANMIAAIPDQHYTETNTSSGSTLWSVNYRRKSNSCFLKIPTQ